MTMQGPSFLNTTKCVTHLPFLIIKRSGCHALIVFIKGNQLINIIYSYLVLYTREGCHEKNR